jgi:predicted amidohydrolase YtcJ
MTGSGMDDELRLVVADRVHTLADPPITRALLLANGRVAAIGDPDVLRARAPAAPVLDLGGAILTPGLTDAHVHLTEWAFARRDVDLTDATSPELAARSVAEHARRSRSGWIRGRGWNPHLWHGRAPHRAVLDAVVADRPIALQSHDMHALWVNSAALHAAGIDGSTADPDGGRIVRDETGEPTGLLLEWAGPLVTRKVPAPTVDEAVVAVHEAQRELHSLGITGVHSLPGVHLVDPDPLPVLLRLWERGALRLRVLQHIGLDRLEDALRLGLRSGFGDAWFRIGAVKMFLDGALGSRTAWMRAPYQDGSGCGMRTLDPAEFRAHVRRAARGGVAAAVHAIGDAAVSLALDVLGAADTRVAALPHRIEHMQCCPPERFADAAAAGISCSMQPAHLITDWRIADREWGVARSSSAFALASLLAHGTLLAFGSDVPVEPVDPRRGLYAAVTRQDLTGEPRAGWFAEQRIDTAAALRAYTIGPARAAGLPAPHGSLAPGAPADWVAWERDPLTCEPQALLELRCVATMVGGELVYH